MDSNPTKAPTTISIDASYKAGLVETFLDEDDFMYLGKRSAQRDDIFLFAVALGWRHEVATKMNQPCSGGFIRISSCPPRLKAIVNLIRFNESSYGSPNDLLDQKGSYQLAEQYADAGLSVLQSDLDTRIDSETYANELIAEMNAMYERVVIRPAE